MSPAEDFPVEVKIQVRSSQYVRLLKFAEMNNTTVSGVLSQLVARCLGPKGKTRKKRVQVTPEIRSQILAMALRRVPQKEIAISLNLSPATVSNRLKEVGIR